jgi:HlyD family secretion protein
LFPSVKRLAVWFGAIALIVAGAVAYYRTARTDDAPVLVTLPVTRGDVVESVDATGTLEAVITVQVGTQVSGTIKALHADYNSRVRRGQVIAELDPSLFDAQVAQARASILRLEAEAARASVQREEAQRRLRRASELAAQQLIAAQDLEAAEMAERGAEATLKAAEAQIIQARAALNQSEVNLAHTIIRAPIDGIVISRNVDVGQTVAASMQAPTLFVIARDLTRMQVNASVAESDVGRVRPGQSVSFRVDAYPGELFAGRVSLVRLEPIVEQNVVSYITTIDVPNPELKLKPGMTANVLIEIERAADVLRVPNAALRVRPSSGGLASSGQPSPPPADDRRPVVWVVVDGRLERVPVRTGITDGSQTAVLEGALAEGTQVVTGFAAEAVGTSGTSRSPLLPFGGRSPGGRASRPPGT